MGTGIHAAFVAATVITQVSTFVQFAIFTLARTKKKRAGEQYFL